MSPGLFVKRHQQKETREKEKIFLVTNVFSCPTPWGFIEKEHEKISKIEG